MTALVLALVVAGCSGGGTAVPERTDPTVPPAPPPDVTEIPKEITLAYVQAVARELDRSYGDIARLVKAEGRITTEVLERLEALYPPSDVKFEVGQFHADVANDFEYFESPIGDRRTVVEALLRADPTCVVAMGTRDSSDHYSGGQPVVSVWILMQPSATGPTAYNRTPWTFVYDAPYESLEGPDGTCVNYDY